MKTLKKLLREARSEIIGGIVVLIIGALVSQIPVLYNRIKEAGTSKEETSLSSDPSNVNASDYPFPSEMETAIHTDESTYVTPIGSDTKNLGENTDLGTLGAELWRINLSGQLQSAPIVDSDGSIYIVTSSGVMLSIDPSGKELWRVVLGGASVTRNYSLPILKSDKHLYIVYDGELLSITKNGTLAWSFSKPLDGMLTAQPAIGLDGTIYLMTNNSNLLAVSPEGNELWSQSLCQVMGGGTWPGPAVGSDGTVYGVCKGEDIYALDPKSGIVLWTYHSNDQMESTPIAGDNGLVYFASTGGQVIAMQPDSNPRWQNSVAGSPGYIQMIDAPVVRGPNGLIFVTPRHGSIYALEPKTGEILWSAKIGGQGVGINPVAVAVDGSVYARNLNGELFCISPSGDVHWQIDPINEGLHFSPPATGSHGELYLGIENQLIAFQTDTK